MDSTPEAFDDRPLPAMLQDEDSAFVGGLLDRRIVLSEGLAGMQAIGLLMRAGIDPGPGFGPVLKFGATDDGRARDPLAFSCSTMLPRWVTERARRSSFERATACAASGYECLPTRVENR